MWAYKLGRTLNHLGMTRSADSVRNAVMAQFREATAEWQKAYADLVDEHEGVLSRVDENTIPPPSDTVRAFDADATIARNMARSLGWDGTIFGELQCFLVPTATEYRYGFILTQATGGQRFLVSPVPLAYLDDHIDWDAHISVDEAAKTQAALSGGSFKPPPLSWDGKWRTSRAGNPYTFINGAQATVFGAGGGYKAVISSQTTNLKVFTRLFSTQTDCVAYVVEHFYALVKDWAAAPSGVITAPAIDNPFAGVDWGDDDA